MSETAQYVYVVCQVGAEGALKNELAREWPALHLSYSRPGLVTFKWTGSDELPDDLDLRSTFARTYGFSLGRLSGTEAEPMAADFWKLAGERLYPHLHVWQRDISVPGYRGFEPGVSALCDEVARAVCAAAPPAVNGGRPPQLNVRARSGDYVMDCIVVEPNEWLVGYHQANSVASRHPGGVCLPMRRDEEVISRAYWKMLEALTWSQLPVVRGDKCAEIGSAPGGASQALLQAGLQVMGIDPALMDEELLEHPRFTHVRKRAGDMKRRDFRGIRWLMADSNVVPESTLAMVEDIVTHREVNVRGLLLTLKLPEWELADHIPEYVSRVRSWGFRYVRTRQLALNRQEICLAALRDRALRRPPRSKRVRRPSVPPTEPQSDEL